MIFPITGTFLSKKGIRWSYIIYADLTVEQYHRTIKRGAGGYKKGKDVYAPKCSKELKEHIKAKYALDVR